MWGTTAIVIAGHSQLLYLALVLTWWFRWMRFYPGNPIEHDVFFGGLLLSGAGLLTSVLGIGFKRCVGVGVAATTGVMWILGVAVSSAI
jgi:hypothetical protein